jgi:hypothetical protein
VPRNSTLWRTSPEMLFQGDQQIQQIEEQKAQMAQEQQAKEHEMELQKSLISKGHVAEQLIPPNKQQNEQKAKSNSKS